jgi:Aldehyde dehydrogenase family
MALLDDAAWQGKLWTGAWTDGSGGTYDVVEPATGDVVGAVGRATPEDVAATADRAVEAQRAWAVLPFEDRARVLRRAGEVLEAHAPSPARPRPAARSVRWPGSTSSGRTWSSAATPRSSCCPTWT